MTKPKNLLFIMGSLFTIVILSACGPLQTDLDATATQAAIAMFATQIAEAPTATQIPTNTSTPTSTPTATPSPTPTPTDTPTSTPSPTNTPIATPTPIPDVPEGALPDLKIPNGLFAPEVEDDKFYQPAITSQEDWYLYSTTMESILPIPAGWSTNETGKETHIMFFEKGRPDV